jgi:PEP-CTERM motif-containing protein
MKRTLGILTMLLLFASQASALSINYNSPTNIFSIDNIDVNGKLWSIRFQYASFQSVEETGQSFEPFNSNIDINISYDDGRLLAGTLQQILRGESDFDLEYAPSVFDGSMQFHLAVNETYTEHLSLFHLIPTAGLYWENYGENTSLPLGGIVSNLLVAVATPVPEPSTILLLSMGVFVIVGKRKFSKS